MLDRSEHPNLFDPGRQAGIADEPRPDPGEPTQPQPRRAPLDVGRSRTPLLAGRVALGGAGLRCLLLCAPVAVLLALLLTHEAGCGRSGRSTVTTEVTRVVAVATPPAPRTRTARVPAKHSRAAPRPVTHAPHRPPAPVRQPTITVPPTAQAPPPARVAPPAPAPARVLPAAPAPSDPTSPRTAALREASDEFGFEH